MGLGISLPFFNVHKSRAQILKSITAPATSLRSSGKGRNVSWTTVVTRDRRIFCISTVVMERILGYWDKVKIWESPAVGDAIHDTFTPNPFNAYKAFIAHSRKNKRYDQQIKHYWPYPRITPLFIHATRATRNTIDPAHISRPHRSK